MGQQQAGCPVLLRGQRQPAGRRQVDGMELPDDEGETAGAQRFFERPKCFVGPACLDDDQVFGRQPDLRQSRRVECAEITAGMGWLAPQRRLWRIGVLVTQECQPANGERQRKQPCSPPGTTPVRQWCGVSHRFRAIAGTGRQWQSPGLDFMDAVGRKPCRADRMIEERFAECPRCNSTVVHAGVGGGRKRERGRRRRGRGFAGRNAAVLMGILMGIWGGKGMGQGGPGKGRAERRHPAFDLRDPLPQALQYRCALPWVSRPPSGMARDGMSWPVRSVTHEKTSDFSGWQ